jgi:hypothetical protein
MIIETGILAALSNPAVLQTILSGMVVTSLVMALPKPGTLPAPLTKKVIFQVGYKFFYDWFVGFISLKEGRPIPTTITSTAIETSNASEKMEASTQTATFPVSGK